MMNTQDMDLAKKIAELEERVARLERLQLGEQSQMLEAREEARADVKVSEVTHHALREKDEEIKRLRDQNAQFEQRVQELVHTNSMPIQELSQKTFEIQALKSELEGLKNERLQYKSELEDLRQTHERLKSEHIGLKSELERKDIELENLREEGARARQSITELKGRFEREHGLREEFEDRLESSKQNEREQKKQIDRLQERLAKLPEKLFDDYIALDEGFKKRFGKIREDFLLPFIATSMNPSTLSKLYEFIIEEVRVADERFQLVDSSLLAFFDELFSWHARFYGVERLLAKVGDEFNEERHSKLAGANQGRITTVLFQGYRTASKMYPCLVKVQG